MRRTVEEIQWHKMMVPVEMLLPVVIAGAIAVIAVMKFPILVALAIVILGAYYVTDGSPQKLQGQTL